jgi:hypothetical protein
MAKKKSLFGESDLVDLGNEFINNERDLISKAVDIPSKGQEIQEEKKDAVEEQKEIEKNNSIELVEEKNLQDDLGIYLSGISLDEFINDFKSHEPDISTLSYMNIGISNDTRNKIDIICNHYHITKKTFYEYLINKCFLDLYNKDLKKIYSKIFNKMFKG